MRATALHDVVEQAPADGVSLIPCLRTWRDDLDEVVPLLCDRVSARVHAHAKGAAGQLVNAALLPLPWVRRPGHGGHRTAFVSHLVSRWARPATQGSVSAGQCGGDEGNRTPNPRLAKAVLCQLSYVPRVPEGPSRQDVTRPARAVGGAVSWWWPRARGRPDASCGPWRTR